MTTLQQVKEFLSNSYNYVITNVDSKQLVAFVIGFVAGAVIL